MDLVQERHVKTVELHRQLNMPDMEALVTIRQLRFLIRVAKMDVSRLTRQVMISQGVRTKDTHVKGSKLTSRTVEKTDPSPCLEPLTRNFDYVGELEFG